MRDRIQFHGLAAGAGRELVGSVEEETGAQLRFLVVHLGAGEEQQRLGIDIDCRGWSSTPGPAILSSQPIPPLPSGQPK